MIAILVSVLLLLPTFAGLGNLMERFLGKIFNGISSTIILGICGLSCIWTIIAFFAPLNQYTEIITLVLGWFFFVKNRLYLPLLTIFSENKVLITFFGLIIVLIGSFAPFILDHFGYYVPSILWLKDYGLVKGIANLDLILGQMSVWHILQAGFSHFSDAFLRLNTVLLLVYLMYIAERKVWIHLIFFPFLLFFLQSPSPDLPVIIFSLILLQEVFIGNKNSTLILGLSAFVFMIKPTMIWLPVFSFLYSFFILKTNWRNYILGSLVLVLFFIKNLWTFGYPVFPVSIIDFNLPWKPQDSILQDSSKMAILKTYDVQYSYEEILKFTFWDYPKNWLSLTGLKSFINIAFILSLSIFTVFALIKKKKLYSFLYIAVLIKAVLVLAFSAQYRFFIDVFFVLVFVLFYQKINKKTSIAISSVLCICVLTVFSYPKVLQLAVPSFRLSNFMRPFQWKQLYQPNTYQLNKYHTFKIGALTFNVSKNYPFNFDTPIPAISTAYLFDDEKYGIIPQPVDSTNFKKGFKWKKMSKQEQLEAQKIIQFLENSQPSK